MPATCRRNTGRQMETFKFRALVRGDDKTGKRLRRVRNIEAPTFELAWASFEAVYADMAKGLSNVYPTVLPPVGIKVNGQPSKGFVLAE